MTDTLDLNDFNIENQELLQETKLKKKPKLDKKIQVNLTTDEYDSLYEKYEKSGYSSFAGYIRMELKNINFIQLKNCFDQIY